jgi:GTP-binding protein HflX
VTRHGNRTGAPPDAVERAALVGLTPGGARRFAAEESLEELAGLADAVGAAVAYRLLQERPHPDPATCIGSGKLATLRAACDEVGVDLVVFDNELSPAQLRNLEKALDRRVVDRTQIILDIFASRARTREGKLQVELAQLKYLLPRLVGAGAALSRLGGGIGTRGPGETKLEMDRRRIRHRIATLTRELGEVRRRRSQLRDRRAQGALPAVALVGYTNAGKTTLFNRLTRESAQASDALFVTLDPLVRQVRLPDGPSFTLSDTVGFIDRLPHTLVAAFRATLEEVTEADLLVHVVDASSADHERRVRAVHAVLGEVDAGEVQSVTVLNKVDRIDEVERRRLLAQHPGAVAISARTGEGMSGLLEAIAARLALDTVRVVVELDAADEHDRERMAWAYRIARVLSHTTDGTRTALEVSVARRWLDRLVADKKPPRSRPPGDVPMQGRRSRAARRGPGTSVALGTSESRE